MDPGKIDRIIDCISKERYKYQTEFMGCISSSIDEDEEGLHKYVALSGDNFEGPAYALHTITIDNDIFTCQEFEGSYRLQFANKKKLDIVCSDNLLRKLVAILNEIIVPFDFENYALESFDYVAVAEAIPYGNLHCLCIDNCVFMIEEDVNEFDDYRIQNFLKEKGWSMKRIKDSLSKGYELNSDVDGLLSELDLVYIPPALAQKIATARKELLEGRTLGFDSATEAAAWMDSL